MSILSIVPGGWRLEGVRFEKLRGADRTLSNLSVNLVSAVSTKHQPSRNCYRKGCRTPECREAHRAYMAHRRKQRAYGRGDPTVPADVTLAYINFLLDKGWKKKQIAQRALGRERLQLCRYSNRVRKSTAEAIRRLALSGEAPPS